jgi:hypothetical protein
MGRRRHVVLLLAALGVVFSASCSSRFATATGSGDDDSPFFAAAPHEADAVMQALFSGPLAVEHDCVLIGQPGDFALPIWPKGFTVGQDAAGRVAVLDGSGSIVATDGTKFETGGGFIAEFRPKDRAEDEGMQVARVEDQLGYGIPDPCLGENVYGIWLVGDVDPLPN